MGFFKKWKEKKTKNQEDEDVKKPSSSYEIYNDHMTITLQTSVKEEKTSDAKEREMAEKKGRNIYYVSARKDKTGKKIGWEVKKENAEKVTKVCETKEEAIAFVKEKAGNQGSTCIIRKIDGSIQQTIRFDDSK